MSSNFAWISLIIQTPLYLLLYLYFDSVVPNNFGIARPCCFCFKKREKVQKYQFHTSDTESNPRDIVDIENISLHYGSVKAVQNLSLKLSDRKLVAFLGHNGAGKTSTINMITGMVKPTSGNIHINGSSVIENI